ncbi:MAG: PAS domain S-box protein [Methyloversatilis sp.]|uniref:PAS domain S-box protein n=1 Tax=Methyloversatilis sp. TaxID=2569862 RepID=UPI002735FFD8|nr:PAS domain S-box protein [Methyloversatilis sp.]MDP3871486.1 PAS domain S-box protein [Methyloversatilis sp.]
MKPHLVFAFLSPVVALVLQWLLWPWIEPFVWFFFFPAVFVSARVDGIRGGMVGALLSIGLASYFFIPPRSSWAVDMPSHLPAFGLVLLIGYLSGIDSQRQKRALRAAEQRLIKQFDSVDVGVGLVASDGHWISVNQKLREIVGYGHSDLLSRKLTQITHPNDQEPDLLEMHKKLAHGTDRCAIEKRHVRKDGSSVWLKITLVLCPCPNGDPDYFIVTVDDIDEAKASEAAHSENADRMRTFIEHAPAALAIFDTEMRYLAASQRWKLDYGLDDREIEGLSHYEIFVDIPERWKMAHRSGLAGQVVQAEDDRFERADGSVQWLRWEICPWYLTEGGVGGIAVLTEDITRVKLADEALRTSERRLRIAQEGAQVGLWEWDFQRDRFYWSPKYEQLYGKTPAGMSARKYWRTLVHPDDLPIADAALKQHVSNGDTFEIEIRVIRSDGEIRWMYVVGVAQFDSSGRAVLMSGFNIDVTARKNAEQALLENQAQLLRTEAIAHLGSWQLDLVGNRLCWSDEVFRIFGLTPDEFHVSYETFLQQVHPDDREEVDNAYSHSLRDNVESYDIEHRILRRDGEIRFVHEKCQHFRDASGRVVRSVGMIHDITERIAAEQALRQSEARLEAFSKASFEAIVICEEGRIVDCNAQLGQMLSCPVEELRGRSIEGFIAQEHRESAMQAIAQGHEGTFEYDMLGCDGVRITVEARGRKKFVRTGACAVLVFRDVTMHRRAERLLNVVTDAAPVLISYVDHGLRHRMINAKCEEWFGRTRDDVIGRHVSELLGAHAYELAVPWIARTLAGEKVTYEAEITLPLLGRRIISFAYIPSCVTEGAAPGFCAVMQDVTDRTQGENALRRSEERFRTVLEHAADAVLIANPMGNFVYANPQASAMLGFSVEELCAMDVSSILPAQDFETSRNLLHELHERGYRRTECDLKRKDGSKVSADINTVRLPCGDLLSVCRDITERKAAHEAILRAKDDAEQASRAKSHFLSRMSHELRTPMNAILGFSQLLRSDAQHPLDDLQREHVTEIVHAGRHLLDLINEVLDLSRIEAGHLEVNLVEVDLGALMCACLNLTRPDAEVRGIEFQNLMLPVQVFVVADRVRLKQVLLNLLSNAVKYNRPGGTVSIRCSSENGTWVAYVSDTGEGLTYAQQARLFTPFDRLGTDLADGTGIGLALCKHLMTLMGGSIGVSSEPGAGCRFWIRLPSPT